MPHCLKKEEGDGEGEGRGEREFGGRGRAVERKGKKIKEKEASGVTQLCPLPQRTVDFTHCKPVPIKHTLDPVSVTLGSSASRMRGKHPTLSDPSLILEATAGQAWRCAL